MCACLPGKTKRREPPHVAYPMCVGVVVRRTRTGRWSQSWQYSSGECAARAGARPEHRKNALIPHSIAEKGIAPAYKSVQFSRTSVASVVMPSGTSDGMTTAAPRSRAAATAEPIPNEWFSVI